MSRTDELPGRTPEPSRATGWIRDPAEPGDRRPADIAALVVVGIGVAVTGVWAQTESGVDLNTVRPINHLTSDVTDLGKFVYAAGSIWVVVAAAAALFVFDHRSLVLRVLLGGAWGIAVLLNYVLGHHDLQGVSIHVRTGSGPVYPSSHVAVIAALAITMAPFLVRPARRALPGVARPCRRSASRGC